MKSKIKDYFNSEIQEGKIMDKKLNKYIAAIVYFDKTLVSLSATSGRVYIISFVSVIRAPIGIASASFILVFSLTTRIIEKLLSIIKKKRKSIIRFLC